MREANYDYECLPPEVVEEILSYLPTKSLIRFRCVSKAWLHLISQNQFVRKHLNRRDAAAKRTTLMVYDACVEAEVYCFPLSIPTIQMPISGSHLVVPFPFDAGQNQQLLASCDGLLCVSVDNDSIFLWNPSTKSHWQVPSLSGSCKASRFGMGYDDDSTIGCRDYRVLKLVWNFSDVRGVTEAHMYTLSSNSWSSSKFEPPPPRGYSPLSEAAFVNGSIHWLFAPTPQSRSPFLLISFHLSSTQECREMPLPPDILFWPAPPDRLVSFDLCALDGLLCIHKVSTSRFVLWAMRDYSYHMSSWAKLIDIEFGEDEIFDEYRNPMEFQPLHMYKNGEVLMSMVTAGSTELMICKDDAVLFREVLTRTQSLFRQRFLHVDTLVSPLPDVQSRQKKQVVEETRSSTRIPAAIPQLSGWGWPLN